MLDIDEMGQAEISELLRKVGYGHLGVIHEGKPYVMPMHYYFENSDIYLFTTVGMKTHDMDADPDICLQVEEVHSLIHWRSVIVTGQAKRLTEQQDIDRITQLVKKRNPALSPAINRTWTDSLGRDEEVSIYWIQQGEMSGRTTDGVSSRSLADA